jgi:hypothetical protein
MLLVHRINRTWVLRGALEPHGLFVSDLTFHLHGVNEEFTGLTSISLETIRKAKTKKLSMGNTNFVGEDFDNSILQDSKNKYCVVSMILFYMKTHMSSQYEGKFFLHKCGEKERKIRDANGDKRLGDEKRPFGIYYFNNLAKQFAKMCDFTNPKK